jgi:hypothetical protein
MRVSFLVIVAIAGLPAWAQNREAIATAERLSAAAPKGPAPRTSSGKPDLSGLWTPDATFIYNIESALKKGEKLPLQPWAEKLAAQRMSKDDPEANCLPTGVPRQAPYPWRVVQTPTHIFFLYGHSALLANTELFEYICNENNQDVPHITRKDDTR